MTKINNRTVGFCEQYITLNANGRQALELIDFLCCDLKRGEGALSRTSYDVRVGSGKPAFELIHDGKTLYGGECQYELAYAVINEIIHQSVVDNSLGFAIHAAALGTKNGGILLPGKSGSGKSTLSAWLVASGCTYLTDELVVLNEDGSRIVPFTRPFSFKAGSRAVLESFADFEGEGKVAGAKGFMLPHRLLSKLFCPSAPPLSLVLFPEYRAGAVTELKEISGAEGCARILECYVNARNFESHGIQRLAKLTRAVPFFQLTYGDFSSILTLLQDAFPMFFTQKS
ncbi:MAG: hypothetical protein GY702_06095 [Desulfobulbaceae bacterium]|nr:hypothetical protein [Desulfobulbaceae bacterium]